MILNLDENIALKQFRSGMSTFVWDETKPFPWTQFGIFETLKICQLIRTNQYENHVNEVSYKEDNSPATLLEEKIEEQLSENLSKLPDNPNLIGEESGGEFKGEGLEVAIDPIDGTRAFLTGSNSYSTAISFFKDGLTFLSLVGNPSTGEIFYSATGKSSRIITLSFAREIDYAYPLPLKGHDQDKILLDVHPSRRASRLFQTFFDSWDQNKIRMLRSSGGSPSLALSEAAKGHYIYINLWANAPTSPFDLSAGAHILQSSGGFLLNREGKTIDPLKHEGIFFAGHNKNSLQTILDIISPVL